MFLESVVSDVGSRSATRHRMRKARRGRGGGARERSESQVSWAAISHARSISKRELEMEKTYDFFHL